MKCLVLNPTYDRYGNLSFKNGPKAVPKTTKAKEEKKRLWETVVTQPSAGYSKRLEENQVQNLKLRSDDNFKNTISDFKSPCKPLERKENKHPPLCDLKTPTNKPKPKGVNKAKYLSSERKVKKVKQPAVGKIDLSSPCVSTPQEQPKTSDTYTGRSNIITKATEKVSVGKRAESFKPVTVNVDLFSL